MEFKSWEELTHREQLLSTISDVHKDVYGVRYRGNSDHMSDADLEKFLDSLYEDIKADYEENLREVDVALLHGAADVETAKRWLAQI